MPLDILHAHGLWISHSLHQGRGDEHEDTAGNDGVNAIVVQKVDHEPAKEQ
jgi:hypothetical protein